MRRILLFYFLTVSITAYANDIDDDTITIITYSPDGKYIASAEYSGLIRIYNSVTLDVVGEFVGQFEPLVVEISPDNLYTAVVGRHSPGIFIYEIKTGNTKFRYDEVWPISISYRFDGQRLVSASRNGIITVFDTTKGEEIMTFIIPPRNEHDKTNKVSYSPDGNKIIVSSVNQISIWDANNGIELKTLTEQDALVLDAYASFSQDGTKIIMSYWIFSGREGARYRYTGKIRIYDATHYVLLYSHDLGDETSDRSSASFVLNSNYIIILYYRVRVRDGVVVAIMNYTDGNIINTYTFNFYTLWAIGPDGRSVCYSERKNDINILRIN